MNDEINTADLGKKPSRPILFFLQNLHHKGFLNSCLILLLIGILLAILQLSLAGFSWVFVDYTLQGKSLNWKWYIISGVFVIAMLMLILNYLKQQVLNRFYLKLSLYYTTEFYWRAVSLPFSFLLKTTSSEFAAKIQIIDPFIQSLTTITLQGILNVLVSIIFFIVLIYFDLAIAFAALSIVIINLGLILYLYVFRDQTYHQYENTIDKSQSCAIDGILSMDTIKESGFESYFFSHWASFYTKAVNAVQSIAKWDIFSGAFPVFFENFANLGILILGIWKIMQGELSIGMLFAILIIARQFMNPTFTLLTMMPLFQRLKIDLNRLNEIFEAPKTNLSPEEKTNSPIIRESSHAKLEGHLTVKELSFGYVPDKPPVIQNINLTITPGKIVAIIGPSGSGKSALIQLISGLYEPWSGEILFDFKPRKDLPRNLICHSLSVVDQHITLFAESIKDNITLMEAFPNQSDLIQAARDVLLHEKIIRKRGGYEFQLNANGNNLSTGERQQLQIARALYRNPNLLLLDEATNSLDIASENDIFKNIRRRGCACLIATHSYNVIKNCDEIIVLKNGAIIQQGTPLTLAKIPGFYRELINFVQTGNNEGKKNE